MSTVDPWTQILQTMHPSYSEWKEALEKGPSIKPSVSLRGRYWQLELEEVWPSDQNYLSSIPDTDIFNTIIDWTTEELESWAGCRRTAWNIWEFKKQRDAEKFVTLFTLKWPQ